MILIKKFSAPPELEKLKKDAEEDITENKGLDYNNLLAVCSGNEKAPGARKRKTRHFTCDKKREEYDTKPAEIALLSGTHYRKKNFRLKLHLEWMNMISLID